MTVSSSKTATSTPAQQTIELQANAKATHKMAVQPGQAFKIVVDSQVYTGQKKINQRELRLVRKGDTLLLVAQDQAEPLLEVSGFYAPMDNADVSAPAQDPTQTASLGTATETPVDLQTLFESGNTTQLAVADMGAAPAAHPPSWGTLLAQAGSAVGTTTTATTTAAATTVAAETAVAATAGTVSAGAVLAAVVVGGAVIAGSSSNSSSNPKID